MADFMKYMIMPPCTKDEFDNTVIDMIKHKVDVTIWEKKEFDFLVNADDKKVSNWARDIIIQMENTFLIKFQTIYIVRCDTPNLQYYFAYPICL